LGAEQRGSGRQLEPGGDLDQGDGSQLLVHRCAEPERQFVGRELVDNVLAGCAMGGGDDLHCDCDVHDWGHSDGERGAHGDGSGTHCDGDCHAGDGA
jgi:hypothetical protein